MYVLGTAGHVDHGKSALIEALSGIHPDRLKEEQEREMTIDLGFAWMTLHDNTQVGIVDVPGHSDFIENMLSGIGGIDAAILLIAADEGIMPQTREHVDILDLLNVQHAVVALSKSDLVEDPEWFELIEADIHDLLHNTVMYNAAIIRVSARTGSGLDKLKEALCALLQVTPPKIDRAQPRLPVDRSFSLPGFGSVVTGTLIDGAFKIGDEVEILPGNARGRIRGLQTHKTKIEKAVPGSRVAINISGVSHHDLVRGMVVCAAGTYKASQRIECSYRHLSTNDGPLKHNSEVKLFCGASQTIARVRVLGQEEINAGEQGWLQLYLRDPIVAVRKDPFILRRPSPAATLGGGIILEPFSMKRHKRMDIRNLERLKTLATGSPSEILRDILMAHPPLMVSDLIERSKLESEVFGLALAELESGDQLFLLNKEQSLSNPRAIITHTDRWEQLLADLISVIKEYQVKNRLRPGIPPEVLRARIDAAPDIYTRLLDEAMERQLVIRVGKLFAFSEFSVKLSDHEKRIIENIMGMFQQRRENPPTRKELEKYANQELLQFLLDTSKLVAISADILLEFNVYSNWVAAVEKMIRDNDAAGVSSVRDRLNTSRKYALALLEHLDAIGLTTREGDFRKLRQP